MTVTALSQMTSAMETAFALEAQAAYRQSRFAIEDAQKIPYESVGRKNQTISVEIAPVPTCQAAAEGVDTVFRALTPSNVDIVLDQYYEVPFERTNLVEIFTRAPITAGKTIFNGVTKLLEQMDTTFFTAGIAGYISNAQIGTATQSVKYETILSAQTSLDNVKAPRTRNLPLPPKDIEQLFVDNRLSQTGAVDVKSGIVGNIAGFNISSNPSVPLSTDTYTTFGFVSDSIVMASSMLEDPPSNSQVTTIYIEGVPGVKIRLRTWYDPLKKTFCTVLDALWGIKVIAPLGGVKIVS